MSGFKFKKTELPVALNEHQIKKELVEKLKQARSDSSHQLDPNSRTLRMKAKLMQRLIERQIKSSSSVAKKFS
jgi:hypothetical protein